jgi:hypothetical protein
MAEGVRVLQRDGSRRDEDTGGRRAFDAILVTVDLAVRSGRVHVASFRAGCPTRVSLPPLHSMRALLSAALPALLAWVTTVAGAQSEQRIATVGWLAGCLEMRSAKRVVEEHRMAERAGTMLGMGRTVGAGGLSDYELTLIKEEGGRLSFEAHPKGQPSATFTARVLTSDSVVFELPEHDFPQRVGYRRVGADSVLAWVEGTTNGKTRRIEFPYARVPCPLPLNR